MYEANSYIDIEELNREIEGLNKNIQEVVKENNIELSKDEIVKVITEISITNKEIDDIQFLIGRHSKEDRKWRSSRWSLVNYW